MALADLNRYFTFDTFLGAELDTIFAIIHSICSLLVLGSLNLQICGLLDNFFICFIFILFVIKLVLVYSQNKHVNTFHFVPLLYRIEQ